MNRVQKLMQVRARYVEAKALRAGAVAGVSSMAIALAYYLGSGSSLVEITGAASMGRVAIYLAVAINFVLFSIAYRRGIRWRHENLKLPLPKRWVFWRDTLTLSFAHNVLLLAALALLAFGMDHAFIGLAFDPYTASLVVGVVVGISTYVMLPAASNVTIGQIVVVLGTILVGGVFVAMLTNGQADWWQVHFSYLGMAQSEAARAFNFTLIFSGLVILSLTETIVNSLAPALSKHHTEMKMKVIKGAFIFIAFALAGVGLFPYVEGTINATLHNWSATALVIGFLFLIGTLKWTSPDLSAEFFTLSYVLAGSLIVCAVLFGKVGYLNLTAFELLSFSICFAWLMLYLRNLALLTEDA